jgi:hypothetical protein
MAENSPEPPEQFLLDCSSPKALITSLEAIGNAHLYDLERQDIVRAIACARARMDAYVRQDKAKEYCEESAAVDQLVETRRYAMGMTLLYGTSRYGAWLGAEAEENNMAALLHKGKAELKTVTAFNILERDTQALMEMHQATPHIPTHRILIESRELLEYLRDCVLEAESNETTD